VLGLKPFWAGIFCVVLGAAALYFGRGLAVGTMKAPGPGAFPLILSLAVLLFGAAQILRAVLARPPEDPPRAPLWRSPLALAAGIVAILAAVAAFWGPASPYFTKLGAGPHFAWRALVLALAAAAAMLAPGGTPARALGAVLAGLLLGLSGMDPIDKIERLASVEAGIWVNFVHGLFLAIVAYHIGFNALLMAAAAALAVPIETALRQGLAGAEGSFSFAVDRPIDLALLVAAIAVAGVALWLRRNQGARDAAPMEAS
jgi:TctA family transporter